MTFHSDGVRASSFLFFICSQRKTNKQSLFIGLLHLFEFGAGFKNHPKQIRLSFENKQNFHKNTRVSNPINRFRNSQFFVEYFVTLGLMIIESHLTLSRFLLCTHAHIVQRISDQMNNNAIKK